VYTVIRVLLAKKVSTFIFRLPIGRAPHFKSREVISNHAG